MQALASMILGKFKLAGSEKDSINYKEQLNGTITHVNKFWCCLPEKG